MYDDPRDDSASDKVAAQLESLFALALADEPESTVTAASVLREVRAESEAAAARWSFGDWLRDGGWKWGGALVAAAALVGAVIVLPPMMGGAGSDSATAGASAEMARADDSDDGDTGSDDAASGQAYSMADADAGPADQDEAGAASADSAQAAVEAPSADMAAESGDGSADGSAEMPAERNGATEQGSTDESAEGSGEATEERPAASGPEAGSMPPLTDRQWDAAVAALPAGTTVTAQTLGGNPGGIAGNLLMLSGGGSIQVVVERTGGTETFIDAGQLRDSGYLVADDETDGVRVTAAADREAQSSVSQADLDRIAAAVRGSS